MISEVCQTIDRIRPKPNKELGQCPVDSESLERRVSFILKYLNSGKFLIIGDDDLLSVALSKLSQLNLTVIETDERIINTISNNANAIVVKFDLRNIYNNLWPKINSDFDGFFTDPPYTADGMKIFIAVGISNIKEGGIGFIACPYMLHRSESLDLTKEVISFVISNGCIIEAVIPFFHNYLDSTKSSIIVVRKIEKKKIEFDFLHGYKNFYPKNMREIIDERF